MRRAKNLVVILLLGVKYRPCRWDRRRAGWARPGSRRVAAAPALAAGAADVDARASSLGRAAAKGCAAGALVAQPTAPTVRARSALARLEPPPRPRLSRRSGPSAR